MAEAPAPESSTEELFTAEVVTTSEVVASVVVSLIAGGLYLALWAYFRGPLRRIYEKRVQLTDLAARPPPLRMRGLLNRCLGFLAPVFTVSDAEFAQTAGLDALILCRFLMLGFQMFVAIAALCCSVMIPLVMTGQFVNSNTNVATADLMRYTLSNIQPGSPKLWAPFALSYAVLAYAGYCLFQHYKSYAMLRLLYLHHQTPNTPGEAPRMAVVGLPSGGWAAVRSNLLALFSPYYMMRRDQQYVKQYLEQCAAAQAEHAQSAAAATKLQPAECVHEAGMNGAAKLGLEGDQSDSEDEKDASSEYAKAAVLPWWLPPEQIPAAFSVERGTSGAVHGKTDPASRKRVLTVSAAGQPTWVSAEQYAVLFTIAGPPPSKELWRLLRPAPPPAPEGVVVEAAEAEEEQEAHVKAGSAVQPGKQDDASGAPTSSDSSRMAVLGASGGQEAGRGAEYVAARLEEALQELFPGSFAQLLRVYSHQAVDKLLSQHEAAATHRDRCATLAEQARAAAAAPEALPAKNGCSSLPGDGKGSATESSSGQVGGKLSWRQRRAAAHLAKAEAELAEWQRKAEELEEEIEEARAAALQQPLGTAFIALFSDQTAAAMASYVQASFAPTVHFNVRPCPGPDNINWSALWATWRQRIVSSLSVVPFLVVVMIFPIGVLTGALSNLSTAVCGGTPESNSLYWPWYCEQQGSGAKLVKELLQGILPSLISMTWDTYVLPMAFFFAAQAERRHLALGDLDRRITMLFFCFNIFNTFLGSVLGGAVFQQIGSVINEPGYWLQMLGASLPTASSFFLNYLIIHTLATNVFRFIWPHEGTVLFVIFRALGMCRPKCERDHAMIRSPPSFRGARHFGSFLLIQIMALSYAVIAPLVLPCAVGFFLTAWITWRYCCLYFYQRSYESGGRIFETLFTLMVWTMSLFSLFSSLVLATKKAYAHALIMTFTQLPALLIYHKRVSLGVGHYAKLLPLQATLSAPKARVDPAVYLPPPLRPQAVGWYPEWGKVWEKYGISRYALF